MAKTRTAAEGETVSLEEAIELWPSLDARLSGERRQLEEEIGMVFLTHHHFHNTWLRVCRWFEYKVYEFQRAGKREQADALKSTLDDLKKIANSKRKGRP